MKLLVWGLGYVGTVSAACLAHLGHEVVGVEPNEAKVETLMAGKTPISEPKLGEAIREAVASGRLRAATDPAGLVEWAEASLVCVGTPSSADGSARLDALFSVADEIGSQLAGNDNYHVVIIRSTVFPGTVEGAFRQRLEGASGRRAGDDVGLAMNPEFLRETTAIDDFHSPPFTVVGAGDARSEATVAALYEDVSAPVFRVAIKQAELVKLACNAFHALKVGFANEIGRVSDALSMDGRQVMEILCADDKLNISPAYLRPGFAFGGSCLPKDLRALTSSARRLGVELPILDGVLPSNRLQIDGACAKIQELGGGRVAVLGLSFKPNTDDVRESPTIQLVRALWEDGVDVVVHDPDIRLDEMLGSNRDYLERQLPQVGKIATATLADAVAGADVVVVTQRRPEFAQALADLGQGTIVDLVGIDLPGEPERPAYTGMSW